MISNKIVTRVSIVLLLVFLSACAKNPVTGRNELLLMSEQQELQIGAQQYAPLRQMQGGDYSVDKELVNYVRRVGQKLARVSDRKLPYEFNVLNDSTPNAWALPGGKISINRGLLTELNSEAELAAVLGHEIVHAAAKHGARGQTRAIALQGLVLGVTVAGAREGYGELAQLGSTVGASLINSKYGRDAELESDRYGMEYMARAGYDLQGAVDLQNTFVRLSAGGRQDFISGLFASHPPSPERVKANRETAARLNKPGKSGREEYQRATAKLKRSAPAYKKYDLARKALKEKKPAQAISLVREAIRIQPNEGRFHSLLGDVAQLKKDYSTARRHYDKAITLDNNYFYYYLQRANVFQATNNRRAAKADYAFSNKLLPTADAQAGLGLNYELDGNVNAAKTLYALAAQAKGPAGTKARSALLRLAPPATSKGALLVRQGISRSGTFMFQLINQTSKPVGNIVVGYKSSRNKSTVNQKVAGVIPAGGKRTIDTGRRYTKEQLRTFRVVVVSAKLAGR